MKNQSFTLKTVKRQTLNQHVYETIKRSILDGEIPAGAKLSEIQIGKQLGVSATPVREAFRMLTMEGLLHNDPWKGCVVQSFDEQTALDAIQCREALEVLALRLFLKRAQEKDILAIEYMLHQSEETEDISEFVATNSAIHNIWIDGCGNTHLQLLMQQLNTILLRERNVSANNENRRGEIIQEHHEILQAIRDKNSEIATKALSNHIQNGLKYSLQQNHKL